MAEQRCGALRHTVLYEVNESSKGELRPGKGPKAPWEWAAVMGQAEIYGWRKLDFRYFCIGFHAHLV